MRVWALLALIFISNSYASPWSELWLTKDQLGQSLMKKGQFKQAEATFKKPDWRAAATYRAGDYNKAAGQFKALQNESGFYNSGNALAHLGQYEQAIQAYDQALALNPKNKDALFNRKLLADFLKQNKDKQKQQDKNQQNKDQEKQNRQEKQDQQNKNQQNKDQQDQNQQDKNQQNKDQQGQDQQNKNQQNKDQQDQNQQDKNQQNKDQQKQDQQDKNQQNKDQQRQNQQDKNQQNKDQSEQNQPPKKQPSPLKPQEKENQGSSQPANKIPTPEEQEKQLAKKQWLRLIPDDPAGLMREKFLRDHLRREEGWYQ
ncbi:MAG: tetratricopeptide repeat protein [Tatlockia sp.]|nr:tetratricopeptide repeat protein [Tatlockia sp.]